MPKSNSTRPALLATLMLLLFAGAASAAGERVLVLDFGLEDDTLLPRVPAELARSAALAPFLRERLKASGVTIIEHPMDDETRALASNGYYLAHPAAVAALGRAAGADWVAFGVQRKFSFLISWLRLFLIDTHRELAVARVEADLRGAMTDERMTRRAAVSLADQLLDVFSTLKRAPVAAR
jgi:hypothetical protein